MAGVRGWKGALQELRSLALVVEGVLDLSRVMKCYL